MNTSARLVIVILSPGSSPLFKSKMADRLKCQLIVLLLTILDGILCLQALLNVQRVLQ